MNNLRPEFNRLFLYHLYYAGHEITAASADACVLHQPTVALCGSRFFILLSPLHDRQGNNGPMEEPH